MVSGAGYVFEEPQPDGIVTKIMIEAMNERHVRPMKIDRRKLDAVATIRPRRLLEFAAQIGDHGSLPSTRKASNCSGGKAVDSFGPLPIVRSTLIKVATAASR